MQVCSWAKQTISDIVVYGENGQERFGGALTCVFVRNSHGLGVLAEPAS